MTEISQKPFFQTEDGQQAVLYTLRNGYMEVDVTDFGGTITAIRVPDRNGRIADVVLGYDDYIGYKSKKYYLGATIGRCANRIGKGRFTLNGKAYQLACNDNEKNHLHGGDTGFDQRVWSASVSDDGLALSYVSPDGEDGYPGELTVQVTITLNAHNELTIHYHAVSTADTLCSLTNHTYFNLAGHDAGDILNHQLMIAADFFTETDAESIPTGSILPVEGTPMDFRTPHAIGERIGVSYQPLANGAGYDHNWILRAGNGVMDVCAELYEEKSGRHLTCLTDSPCIQMYSGNFIDGTQSGKGGCKYQRRGGVALETQYAPDAVNHPDWDSPILRAGEEYDHTTVFRFETK